MINYDNNDNMDIIVCVGFYIDEQESFYNEMHMTLKLRKVNFKLEILYVDFI